MALLIVCMVLPIHASRKESKKTPAIPWPELLLDGGRKLSYQQTFLSERDVKDHPGFWTKLANFVAGEPDYRQRHSGHGEPVRRRGDSWPHRISEFRHRTRTARHCLHR